MFDKKPNRCGFGIHEEKQKEILLQMREVVSNMVFINEKGKEVKLPFQVNIYLFV